MDTNTLFCAFCGIILLAATSISGVNTQNCKYVFPLKVSGEDTCFVILRASTCDVLRIVLILKCVGGAQVTRRVFTQNELFKKFKKLFSR